MITESTIRAFATELTKIAKATAIDTKEELDKVLKPGDILYTKPRHIDGLPQKAFYKVESWFQQSPYTHVGLYIGENTVVDAGIWKRPKNEDKTTEVHKVPLKTFVDRYKFKVLRVDASKKEKQDAIDYVKKQVGKKFNFAGMLRLAIPYRSEANKKDRERKEAANSFFCSELVANAYQPVGIAKRHKLQLVMPSDIHKSNKTKTVAEFK